jgi:hypothetical protein
MTMSFLYLILGCEPWNIVCYLFVREIENLRIEEIKTLFIIRCFIAVIGVVKSTIIHYYFVNLLCGWETERSKALWCFCLRSHSERNKRAARVLKKQRVHTGKKDKIGKRVAGIPMGAFFFGVPHIARAKRDRNYPVAAPLVQLRAVPDIWPVRRPPYWWENMLPHHLFKATNKGWMRNEPHTLHAGYHLLPHPNCCPNHISLHFTGAEPLCSAGEKARHRQSAAWLNQRETPPPSPLAGCCVCVCERRRLLIFNARASFSCASSC